MKSVVFSLFEMKEGWCKVSVKRIAWIIVVIKDNNILTCLILEYGAEYGVERSSESVAK